MLEEQKKLNNPVIEFLNNEDVLSFGVELEISSGIRFLPGHSRGSEPFIELIRPDGSLALTIHGDIGDVRDVQTLELVSEPILFGRQYPNNQIVQTENGILIAFFIDFFKHYDNRCVPKISLEKLFDTWKLTQPGLFSNYTIRTLVDDMPFFNKGGQGSCQISLGMPLSRADMFLKIFGADWYDPEQFSQQYIEEQVRGYFTGTSDKVREIVKAVNYALCVMKKHSDIKDEAGGTMSFTDQITKNKWGIMPRSSLRDLWGMYSGTVGQIVKVYVEWAADVKLQEVWKDVETQASKWGHIDSLRVMPGMGGHDNPPVVFELRSPVATVQNFFDKWTECNHIDFDDLAVRSAIPEPGDAAARFIQINIPDDSSDSGDMSSDSF